MTKPLILTCSFFLFLFGSCIIPKDARILKRTTKEWRESEIVLHAWADSPFSGMFLTLRNNGKFEHTSSGLIQSFEAGTWARSKDTLLLTYIDSKMNVTANRKMIIDQRTSTLMFEGDSTPVQMRMRILKNEIKE